MNYDYDWEADRNDSKITSQDCILEWVDREDRVIVGEQGWIEGWINNQDQVESGIVKLIDIDLEILLHRDDPYDGTAIVFAVAQANRPPNSSDDEWGIETSTLAYDWTFEDPISDYQPLWPKSHSDYIFMQTILVANGVPRRFKISLNTKLKPWGALVFTWRFLNTGSRVNTQMGGGVNGLPNQFMVDTGDATNAFPILVTGETQFRFTAIYRLRYQKG